MAFVAEFRELAVWDERQKRLSLIDLESGQDRTVSMLGPLSGVHVMAFSPDLRHPDRVELRGPTDPPLAWLTASQDDHTSRTRTEGSVDHRFRPNGQTLASGGDDGVIDSGIPRRTGDGYA